MVDLNIAAAIRAAAPHADAASWETPLAAAFGRWGISTPHQAAAAIGQFTVESAGFTRIVEDTCYRHPELLCARFPSRFATLAEARPFCGDAERIANHAYAGRLGNRGEASGDGWKFRGRGLIQITGYDGYEALATAHGMSVDQAVAWCETRAGAAISAAWFLVSHGFKPLADSWLIKEITRKVNGSALLGLDDRIVASTRALAALGAVAPARAAAPAQAAHEPSADELMNRYNPGVPA